MSVGGYATSNLKDSLISRKTSMLIVLENGIQYFIKVALPDPILASANLKLEHMLGA